MAAQSAESFAAGRRPAAGQPRGLMRCDLCKITCIGEYNYSKHLTGLKHLKKALQASERAGQGAAVPSATGPAPTHPDNPFHCLVCNTVFKDRQAFQQHCGSYRHKARFLRRLMQDGTSAGSSMGGHVHVSLDPSPLPIISQGQSAFATLTITNSSNTHCIFRKCSQLPPLQEVAIPMASHAMSLPPGSSHRLQVNIRPRHLGILQTMLILHFESFTETIQLVAKCDLSREECPVDIEPKAPYQPRPKPKVGTVPDTTIVPGERPPRPSSQFKTQPQWRTVPDFLRRVMAEEKGEVVASMVGRPVENIQGYSSKLANLLWLEELQHEVDIQQYNMEGVELEQAGRSGNLRLKVPGLAENRPSLMRGDALYVRPADGSSGRQEFQGFVHDVRKEEVDLRFHADFHWGHVKGRRYDVRFSVNRSCFNWLQDAIARAAQASQLPPQLVLPQLRRGGGTAAGPAQPPAPVKSWVKPDLNPEQRLAVQCIVDGCSAPLPYLVFGPPGTGKTTTLIEAAVQVLRLRPSSRLLLCAPSNSAADMLAERVLACRGAGSEMMRVNAYQRHREDVPAAVMDVSCWNDSVGAFQLPELKEVIKKRVVVATCLMAAKLHHLGLPPGHFSHVMVDEAGHAEEPLGLAPLAGFVGGDGAQKQGWGGSPQPQPQPQVQVVLAGDPQQLGPIVLSPLAKRLGLDVSMMERLIGQPPFARREGASPPHDPSYVTKLVANYRSHPALLALPSRLFYQGELRACADPIITHCMMGWEGLANKNFPLLFHGLVGEDDREAGSPSWFNLMEAKQVMAYVRALRSYRRVRLTDADIGVITPYRRQVQKIRQLLSKDHPGVKVGSVEEFQGQERKVILISTVRSHPDHLASDLRHRLGFVANPKRLNVALTRAKALAIVVGNPEVLARDPHWAAVLQYARDNGACTGAQVPPLNVEEEAEEASFADDDADLLSTMIGRLTLSGPAPGIAGGPVDSDPQPPSFFGSDDGFGAPRPPAPPPKGWGPLGFGGLVNGLTAVEAEGGEMRRLL